MGLELLARAAAGGGKMDRRLARRLDLEGERKPSAQGDQVEPERPRPANDKERCVEDSLEVGSLGGRETLRVAQHGGPVPLEEVLQLSLVRREAVSDHVSPLSPSVHYKAVGGLATPVAASAGLEITAADVPVARVLAALVADADRRRTVRGYTTQPARVRLSDLRTRLLRDRVFEDPGRLIGRLKRRGLLAELSSGGEKSFEIPYPDALRQLLLDEVARAETVESGPVSPVPDEPAEIRAMDGEFLDHLREVLHYRLEETLEFGRTFDIERLAGYLKGLFGEALYFDSLISLLQQYALADVALLAPTAQPPVRRDSISPSSAPRELGRPSPSTTWSEATPAAGSLLTDCPAGIGYCGGITPVQFLRVGAAYTGRTFNFIVPEFNDWFKYRGMVEPLKLVMEQREVKWETTLGTVGPYTFRSFFSVNYNVRTAGADDYWTTIGDPNFAALEDRMLLRFHPMTRERFRAVEASAERLELGELDFALAGRIRDHLTLVHAIETGHPLVASRFRRRSVRLERPLYDALREVSEKALKTTRFPKFSPRLKSRAVRLAAAAALVAYFREPDEPDGPDRSDGDRFLPPLLRRGGSCPRRTTRRHRPLSDRRRGSTAPGPTRSAARRGASFGGDAPRIRPRPRSVRQSSTFFVRTIHWRSSAALACATWR